MLTALRIAELPPRVAVVSTSFLLRHVLPADPTYLIQRHALYHLLICCIVGGFLEIGAHEDRGCLLDYNSHTPNIVRKIEAGYVFCNACTRSVARHPLGNAVFDLCGALKVASAGEAWSKPRHPKATGAVKIFLCYAGPDRSVVRSLYQRLHDGGFDPWMDKESLLPGQDSKDEIERAVESANFFVACLSRNFQERTYAHREIKLALEVLETMPEGRIYLIPARLEECQVERRLARRQWVDLFEPGGYEQFTRTSRSGQS